MYTFGLTMCALIAVLGAMAIALTKLLDRIIECDEEGEDYGYEK